MDFIILDTSSMVFALSNKVDPFARVRDQLPSYRVLISEGIIGELRKLASGSKKEKKFAAVALALLQKQDIETMPDTGPVDRWIAREAHSRPCMVCTNDIKLKAALKRRGVGVVSMARNGELR